MTHPLPDRSMRSLLSFVDGFVVRPMLATLGFGLLATPMLAMAAPHAHGRRPLPTPLRASAVVETGRHASAASKRGHASAAAPSPRVKAGARTRSTSREDAAAEHGQAGRGSAHEAARVGKKGGHHHAVEPVADPVPMYRAQRGTPVGKGHPASFASNRRHGDPRGSVSSRTRSYGPAPLVASGRHRREAEQELAPYVSGSPERGAGFAERGAGFAARHASSASVAQASSRSSLRDAASLSEEEVPRVNRPGSSSRDVATAAPIVRTTPFAEGVAHPDDEDRLPSHGLPDAGAAALVTRPTAHVSAAPAAAHTPAPTPSIVQGFGSEIAVPSGENGERPAGTRRRSHPQNWTPESLMSAPEPLEEREAITEAAVSPTILPNLYDRDGRLVMPAPMRGSHEILIHQNVMATSDGLERIQDDADLDRLRASHQLVGFPVSESLRVNEDLPMNRRYARPWTVQFAVDMGQAFYTRFHQPIQINSAVRTVRYQARLQMVNGNAAATYGDGASPHLTGQAMDIAKRWMTHEELAWTRGYLAPWMQSGKIDVEEEFQQACFHLSVYRSYGAARRVTQHQVAQVRPNARVPVASTEETVLDQVPDNKQ